MKHGIAWWLIVGWWWYFYKFLLFYLPLCLIRLCGGGGFLDRVSWSKWRKEIHAASWQSDRAFRSASQDMVIEKRNLLGVASVLGSSGNRYKVTLLHCSCPDFQRRGLPCKHMYLLAESAGVLGGVMNEWK